MTNSRNGAPIEVNNAHDLIVLLCQAIAQPPKYTNLINLIDYEKFGVYTFTQIKDNNKWIIPLKDNTMWQLEVTKI